MKLSKIIEKIKERNPFSEDTDNSDLDTLIYSVNDENADIIKELKYSDEHMMELVSEKRNIEKITREKGKTTMGKSMAINPIIRNVESTRDFPTLD